MSIETRTKKRKSGDDVIVETKKVKTVKSGDDAVKTKKVKTIKSGDDVVKTKKVKTVEPVAQPPPLKSALKKPKSSEAPQKTTKPEKSSKLETTKPKKAKAPAVPATVASNDDEQADAANDDDTALTTDQTAALLAGFSSSEDEASDDEDGIDVEKLPAAPTSGKVAKSASRNALATQSNAISNPETTPGVVYVSRIPHGFFEKQMQAYFSQFGNIAHLRLARNRRTGASKHFAFIEFESAAVAEIVAKTMDRYLLFGHILQVRLVPREQINEALWKGGVRKSKVRPGNKIEGSQLRHGMAREGWEKRIEREEKRRSDKKAKLAAFDYTFDMPSVKTVDSVPVKPTPVLEEAVPVEVEAEVAVAAPITAPIAEALAETVVEEIEDATATAADTTAKRKAKGTRSSTRQKKVKVST